MPQPRLAGGGDPISRWKALLSDIGEGRYSPMTSRREGELVVLGSGLSRVDITADTEQEILSADYVFYCLYDKLSQAWIHSLRPDAFDLYILYDDNVDRYITYVQMAEVLLHFVRRGKKVVAIYYGHPGLFATPAHRAIKIAHKEGFKARMRPGISALDYLIAEVGFDPAVPGMLNYEASDFLLRKRRLDPSLHLVLWQVGLVGDFDFKKSGFRNVGFRLLVESLETCYGPDWFIVHYIASSFPGIPSTNEIMFIKDLRDDGVRDRIGPLSTFYLPPKDGVANDNATAELFGLSVDSNSPSKPYRPRDVSIYDDYENYAVGLLKAASVKPGYRPPAVTSSLLTILGLSMDVSFTAAYKNDPAIALTDSRLNSLPVRFRQLLATAHPLAFERLIFEASLEQDASTNS